MPRSHLDTISEDTPAAAATSSCPSPLALRAEAMALPSRTTSKLPENSPHSSGAPISLSSGTKSAEAISPSREKSGSEMPLSHLDTVCR